MFNICNDNISCLHCGKSNNWLSLQLDLCGVDFQFLCIVINHWIFWSTLQLVGGRDGSPLHCDKSNGLSATHISIPRGEN